MHDEYRSVSKEERNGFCAALVCDDGPYCYGHGNHGGDHYPGFIETTLMGYGG